MYFRLTSTKSTPVLQLVHSYRNDEDQPRQRIFLSLGSSPIPKNIWRPLAKEIEDRLKGAASLFAAPDEVSSWADHIISELERKDQISHDAKNKVSQAEKKEQWCTVRPEHINHHNTTRVGPELVLHHAWKELKIGEILSSLRFNNTEIRDAAISIFNRLLDPCSDHALPQWVKTTSLPDLFHQQLNRLSDDRFYRVSDHLHDVHDLLEERLSAHEQHLFNLERTIYLCDLTNTYFEGLCPRNPAAKRTGNSKHKRTDAPHIAFGMVLDPNGFVIKHRVFPGNTHDSTTLLDMVEQLAAGRSSRPLIVVDSGMSSEDNLQELKAAGMDYITVKKRPLRLAYEEVFADLDQFTKIQGRHGKPDVSVAIRQEGEETLVCCYSAARAKKETAILSKAEKRLLQDLDRLYKRITQGRLKQPDKIQQALGRLQERHPRISRYYQIDYQQETHTLVWNRNDEQYQTALQVTGGYILRTNRKNLSASQIWNIYIMLTRVEAGFRALKTDLGLRPIFHHTKKRCEGYIFITVLAYHLLHWIEYTLRSQGITASWPTVRRLLTTHAYTTIFFTSREGQVHRIRKPGIPDTQQRKIYRLLGADYKALPCYHTIENCSNHEAIL